METIANIAQDEGGVVTIPYLCSKGYVTWLIGRNVGERPITQIEWLALGQTLRSGNSFEDWAIDIFGADLQMYRSALSGHGVEFDKYSKNIQCVLLNLAYNMGTTRFNPRKWPNFFAALAEKDYNEMARQLKYTDPANSDKLSGYWTDVPNRAERLYNSILEEINA